MTYGELHLVHVVKPLWLHVPPKVKRHVRHLWAVASQAQCSRSPAKARTSSSSHSSASSPRSGSSSISVQAGVTNGGLVKEGWYVVEVDMRAHERAERPRWLDSTESRCDMRPGEASDLTTSLEAKICMSTAQRVYNLCRYDPQPATYQSLTVS